ncbi:hypothetical protein JW978_01360 [Candidatus Dojkabacteria bacterium]|nr:hypothetical protein [Candidatus Dojkabacteria bacterium]
MIILLEGENYFASLQEYKKKLKEFEKSGLAVEELRADGENFEMQLDLTQNQGLFGTNTLYVLKEFNRLNAAQTEKLELAAQNVDVLIIHSGSFDKRKSFYKNAKKSGQVFSFNRLKGAELESWTNEKIKTSGLKLDKPARIEFFLRSNDDQHIILTEIDKLKKLQDEGVEITKEIVENLITDNSAISVWDLTDNLLASNKRGSIKELDKITRTSEYEQIVGLIVSQLRALYIASLVGTREKMIEYKIHPFIASKLVSKISKFPIEKVKKLYGKIVNMEIAVKTGKIDKDLALDLLVLAF